MKLPGRLTITRDSSDTIRLQIEDAGSSTRFVTVSLPPADFARALTGLGHMPCALDVDALDRVGRLRESERRIVPRPPFPRSEREDPKARAFINAVLFEQETDGWKARRSDFENSHNWRTLPNGEPGVVVIFERYVGREAGPVTFDLPDGTHAQRE